MIEVDRISKAFRIPRSGATPCASTCSACFTAAGFEHLQVLDSVSFRVNRGEAVGIMGRNGSGKSTLLKILCGIYTADGGAVRRERIDYADPRARRRLESRT